MSRFNVMHLDDFKYVRPKEYEKGFLVIKLSSWSRFLSIVQKFHNNKDYIWRGQCSERWPLLSNFDRVLSIRNRTERKDKADELYNKFKRAIMGRRGSNPPELDMYSAFALGRHYGLVTPTLDWTESPYAAAFFAFSEESEQNEKRAVYALNKDLVRWFEKTEVRQNGKNTLVRFINPETEENARSIAQRGILTYTLRREGIIKRVKECYSKRQNEDRVILIKITIPNKDREECLKSLNQMNINHLTLFPDLYGAAMYCNLSLEIENY